ncbi:sulfate adenylyltransferase [Modestobacter sp. DSM 44400]|uniref:adenylyl-sulfate kinase n=1 Tax=Modestobacter sp. DSM 44400 TaxID=1550230 RepID=UPI000895BA28|nr:adenylyl-sulfate kinase [Modestobacter sp. DSM 44400]SDY75409.1 sulfate adenylyltransferase [Modestobacter sp. DSM 44400]
MAQTRMRLTDIQLAALARSAFGLASSPQLPGADGSGDTEFEDAEGVLVAVRDHAGLTVREIPRWRSPAAVRAQLGDTSDVAAWVGLPPDDAGRLPARVLALLPVAGTAPDSATVSLAAARWSAAAHGRELVVVPVPVTAADPELAWEDLAAAYGAPLLGSRVEAAAPRTGGLAVMFTGLSGAGKSTIAGRLVELLQEAGRTVTLLDGDEVRTSLSAGLGFSKADRDTNVRRIGWVAGQIAKHGGIAVCAPIAPYAATRTDARRLVEAQAGPGSFVLVHVGTPLAECEARDRKGLYAKARRGEIAEFTGVSDPYEAPTDAEVTLDTTGTSAEVNARRVLETVLAGTAGAQRR